MAKTSSNCRVMLDAIKQAIKSSFIPCEQQKMFADDTTGKQGNMECRICESNNEETLLCSFDKGGDNYLLFPYFKEEHGLVSMCDYILFAEDDKSLFVFLIELKDSIHRAKRQTQIAQSFAEFLVKRIKETIGDTHFAKYVEYRKVGVKTTRSKMTTKGYYKLAYDPDGYAVLPDYHKFYVKRMKEL